MTRQQQIPDLVFSVVTTASVCLLYTIWFTRGDNSIHTMEQNLHIFAAGFAAMLVICMSFITAFIGMSSYMLIRFGGILYIACAHLFYTFIDPEYVITTWQIACFGAAFVILPEIPKTTGRKRLAAILLAVIHIMCLVASIWLQPGQSREEKIITATPLVFEQTDFKKGQMLKVHLPNTNQDDLWIDWPDNIHAIFRTGQTYTIDIMEETAGLDAKSTYRLQDIILETT